MSNFPPPSISQLLLVNANRVYMVLMSQSWNAENTFNIWQRTSPDSALRRDIDFKQSSKTVFQQRWLAKRYLKGYHADMIQTQRFERWYLPERLPAIHVKQPANDDLAGLVEGRERAGGRTRDERMARGKKRLAQAPVGSMLYINVERRLDVAVFRACFAQSIYKARQYVVGGNVKLNGQKVRRNTAIRCVREKDS